MMMRWCRYITASILYAVGDYTYTLITRYNNMDMVSYALYRIYNKAMIWSSNIDTHGDVWLTDKQKDELMSCVREAFNKDV